MILKSIEFKQDAGESYPNSITVEMSISEAAWIGIKAGRETGNSPANPIYGCLIDNVFSRYWEDGLTDNLYAILSGEVEG